MNIFMQDLSDDHLPLAEPRQLTFVKDRDISGYSWEGDRTTQCIWQRPPGFNRVPRFVPRPLIPLPQPL